MGRGRGWRGCLLMSSCKFCWGGGVGYDFWGVCLWWGAGVGEDVCIRECFVYMEISKRNSKSK